MVYIYSDEGKLQPRAKQGVFTEYPEGVKGFRVWVLEDKKCVISRNVVFREDVMYKSTLVQAQSCTSAPNELIITNGISIIECAGENKVM